MKNGLLSVLVMSETAIFSAGLAAAEAELEAPAVAAAELAALGVAPVPEQAAMSRPAPSNAMNRRIPDPWICTPVELCATVDLLKMVTPSQGQPSSRGPQARCLSNLQHQPDDNGVTAAGWAIVTALSSP